MSSYEQFYFLTERALKQKTSIITIKGYTSCLMMSRVYTLCDRVSKAKTYLSWIMPDTNIGVAAIWI